MRLGWGPPKLPLRVRLRGGKVRDSATLMGASEVTSET